MADFDFGVSGILAGIQARGELQKQSETAAEFPTILATGQVDLQQKQVTLATGKLELQRQTTEMGLLQQAMTSGKLTGGQDISDQLNTLAEIALSSDKPAEANQYARTAADLTKQQSYLTTQQLSQSIKTAQAVSGLLDGSNVKDQNSYDSFRNNAILQASILGSPQIAQAIQKLPKQYNPRVVDNLRNGLQTGLQNAQEKATAARQKAAEAEVTHYQFIDKQAAAETDYYNERARTLAKSGAGSIAAKPSDVKAVTDLMVQDYGDPSDLAQTARFNNRARPVAERAREIMAQSPSTKPTDAYRKAFDEAKRNGWFGGLKVATPRLGMGPEAPAPLPDSKDKTKDNTWYNVNGKSMLLMKGKLYSQGEVSSMESKDDEEPADADADESKDADDAN